MRINQTSYNYAKPGTSSASSADTSSNASSGASNGASSDSSTQKTHHHKHHHKSKTNNQQQSQTNGSTAQLIALVKQLLSLLQGGGNAATNSSPDTTTPPANIAAGEPTGNSNPPASTVTTPAPTNNGSTSSSSGGIKLGVPAYNDPGDSNSFWAQIQNAKPGSVFIMNPNNGPGNTQDPNYKAAVEAAHAKGVKIYGYVSTQYGNRSQGAVQNDISAYQKMYGVDGIFLDEAQLDKSHLSYYKGLSDSMHNAGLEVSANPGQPDIDPSAVDFTDHIMNFEGSYSDYQKAQFPDWTKNVSPDKFWNVIYDTPSNVNFQDLLNTAAKNHAGLIYATDDGGDNPWDNTSSFFKSELNLTA